jgi:DNA mismatch endonuclease (patch repair protein)
VQLKTGDELEKFSKEKRSEIMSRIRSSNTKAELLVFKELRKRKVYFQKHYKRAIGKPDIALPRKKKAVFIDGDFWHGYNYDSLKNKLSKQFWISKIESNIRRDEIVNAKLIQDGWEILRVWENEINKNFNYCMDKIFVFLTS